MGKKLKINSTPVTKYDFATEDGIAKFLTDYITHKNMVYFYVHKYGGYPGGVTETFFNYGDARGILNYAMFNTIKFFNNDKSRERTERTIIGAFLEIADHEMCDVYTKQYCTEKRTISSDQYKIDKKSGTQEIKNIIPTISNIESEKMFGEESGAVESIHKKEIIHKLRKVIATLDELEQKVIYLKLNGYTDDEMAEKLSTSKRIVRTTLIRAKRKIGSDDELEALCA